MRKQVMECILTRRSIRAFTPQPIAREDLEQILQAGRYAPSAMNRQTWLFTVLEDKDKIRALARAVAAELGRGEEYDFYAPAAFVIVSNRRDNRLGAQDCACALENMFLAAHAMGIGSVWINQLCDTCDAPAVRRQLASFGIPEEHVVWGAAALGFAAAPPREIAHNPAVVNWVED